jgi:hypothetical protein
MFANNMLLPSIANAASKKIGWSDNKQWGMSLIEGLGEQAAQDPP